MTIAQKIVDAGGRPPVSINADDMLGPDWFWLRATLPNAGTTAVSLRSVMGTDPAIRERFHPSNNAPDIGVHIEQIQPVLFTGACAALSIAEKQKLFSGLELAIKIGSTARGYALGPYLDEAYDSQTISFDSDDTTAAVQRGAFHGNPKILPRPLTLNLSTDEIELRFSEATPANPGDILVGFFGWVWNNNAPMGKIATQRGQIDCPSKSDELAAAYDRASGLFTARALRPRK